jgi:radical SAM superfamily enzyme YgiQ (UPF0313 family)
MRLYLINPTNPLVDLSKVRRNYWNRFRVWKPLGLMVVAGLTPPGWDIRIFDENHGIPGYGSLPRPDLVGITAFTSQVSRAYEVASVFRAMGVPVVMGGIHVSMCVQEASGHVDAVVTGEAEGVWERVLDDLARGQLQPLYSGEPVDSDAMRPARHDLLEHSYPFGSIQTTRGCPLGCEFCSVTRFNGRRYRQRPIEEVVSEFGAIREKRVLVVDDNLVGTSAGHIERAKNLFSAMIEADLRKHWIGQVTVNFGDDDELLDLAARSGCKGVFIGFESTDPEGLREVGKGFHLKRGRDLHGAVRRIKRHGIPVMGSFIVGLDVDGPGIGMKISRMARRYGMEAINVMFLTPLPGTRLWDRLEEQGRIVLDDFPGDWKYYTLSYPVARFKNLSLEESLDEVVACDRDFYSLPSIIGRALGSTQNLTGTLFSLVGNLSYRSNRSLAIERYGEFRRKQGARFASDVQGHVCNEVDACEAPGADRARTGPPPASKQYCTG